MNHDSHDHGPAVSDFSERCKSSSLNISAVRAKEVAVDFGKNPAVVSPVGTNDQSIVVVTFETHTDVLCLKSPSAYVFMKMFLLVLLNLSSVFHFSAGMD